MGVQKVVERCEVAKENGGIMDLSGCQLIQVPDAIYFMMKDTQLTACNLSSNVITKIPPKFPTNFNFITGNSARKFKLSKNKITINLIMKIPLIFIFFSRSEFIT